MTRTPTTARAVAGSIDNETGTNVFDNAGTFETSFTSGTTTIGVAFNNTGTVNVGAGGTLDLSDGGTDVGAVYEGTGTVEFGGGTRTLDSASSITSNAMFGGGTTTVNGTYNAISTTVDGGTANLLGTIAELGATNISSGTLNIGSSTATVASLTQSGGALSGTGTLTVTGVASLGTSSGYLLESGSGTTDLQDGGTLGNTSYSPVLALDGGRVLQNENDGTFKWVSGTIYMGYNPFGTTVGGSTIVNAAGATVSAEVSAPAISPPLTSGTWPPLDPLVHPPL